MAIDIVNLQVNMFAASQLKPELEEIINSENFDFTEACIKGRLAKRISEYLGTSDDKNAARLRTDLVERIARLSSKLEQYDGIDNKEIDKERCLITSVEYTENGSEIALVILPPKELPKILPCSLGDKQNEAPPTLVERNPLKGDNP